jgi:inosine-uridine nucleoside N-ribohydrolase/formylmethanofuran dehydrogenase subunit E
VKKEMKHWIEGAIMGYLVMISIEAWSKPLLPGMQHRVVIDTDCAIDDLRAISLLLSRPEISIEAFLLSDGTLPPAEGMMKLRALLHQFNADTIPIALGHELKDVNPPWRAFNRQLSWGKPVKANDPCPDANVLLSDLLAGSNEKITFLCLGPLSNLALGIHGHEGLASRIERIIWYVESVKPLQGFNYECDKEAADFIFKSGIRIDAIANLKKPGANFDSALFSQCRDSKTRTGSVIFAVHNQPEALKRLKEGHFALCDDLAAVYLCNPELFDMTPLLENVHIRFNQDFALPSIREAMGDMISGTYKPSLNIVFNEFPAQREQFAYDVREIMDSAIIRYGMEEWKANVMTDEFHGHLGVFSIVGAKMGMRAREFFGIGTDELEVLSYAGTRPPYSCLNDGLQVSTGATLGMGTISIDTDSVRRPEALFSYHGRLVKIRLKQEFLEQVDADIHEGIIKFGLMDDGYWKLIRRNALKYWMEWDRNDIFQLDEITTENK